MGKKKKPSEGTKANSTPASYAVLTKHYSPQHCVPQGPAFGTITVDVFMLRFCRYSLGTGFVAGTELGTAASDLKHTGASVSPNRQ